jgi:hydroxymethylglutaryl-CoA lyase
MEITGFVNPQWVPQPADAGEVARQVVRRPGITYSASVPNPQGLVAAQAAAMPEVAVFLSASERECRWPPAASVGSRPCGHRPAERGGG